MDRDRKATDWSWLPAQMPRVARLLAEKRRKLGDAHVNLCWRRGVVEKQPGWFFAREGALAVGTPDHDEAFVKVAWANATTTEAFLMLRDLEPASAAN